MEIHTQNTAVFCQKIYHDIVFEEKTPLFSAEVWQK
jgi:hypothetical protein